VNEEKGNIDLTDIKESYEKSNRESEGKEEKQKKPRGKAAVYAQEEQKKAEFVSTVKGVGSMILNIIVARLPNPIPLTDLESNSFDECFSRVAYKYASILGNYQEETALGIVSLMIFIPRLKSPKPENKVDTSESK
jgi:hypothetical protein